MLWQLPKRAEGAIKKAQDDSGKELGTCSSARSGQSPGRFDGFVNSRPDEEGEHGVIVRIRGSWVRTADGPPRGGDFFQTLGLDQGDRLDTSSSARELQQHLQQSLQRRKKAWGIDRKGWKR